MEIDKELLQIAFDLAVNSMDFGSGFWEDADVEAMRKVAMLLEVDPMLATPNNHQCKYDNKHEFSDYGRPLGVRMCWKCRKVDDAPPKP